MSCDAAGGIGGISQQLAGEGQFILGKGFDEFSRDFGGQFFEQSRAIIGSHLAKEASGPVRWKRSGTALPGDRAEVAEDNAGLLAGERGRRRLPLQPADR